MSLLTRSISRKTCSLPDTNVGKQWVISGELMIDLERVNLTPNAVPLAQLGGLQNLLELLCRHLLPESRQHVFGGTLNVGRPSIYPKRASLFRAIPEIEMRRVKFPFGVKVFPLRPGQELRCCRLLAGGRST